MTLRNIVTCGVLCFVILAGTNTFSESKPAAPDLKVFYTGYLLGYYRAPNIQRDDFTGCVSKPGVDEPEIDQPSKPAEQFLSEIAQLRTPGDVLVGMGDNFGVELYSRAFGAPGHLHPKSHDITDPRWTNASPDLIGDNVACFLSKAHYDAIVPGKEDFYFGPERLRRIAVRLAAAPATNDLNPVQMLAANLVVKTSPWKDPEEVPDSRKKLRFKPEMPDGVEVNVSEGDILLPFATITFKQAPPSTPYLCQAQAEGRPDSIFDSGSCDKQSLTLLPTDPLHPGVRYAFPNLTGNPDYGLCLGTSEPHCIRFTIAEPFLQKSGSGDPRANWAKPYLYIESKNVVIFGVVDPDITSLAGSDNLAWRNAKYRQEVAALDPAKSLRHALEFFYRTEAIKVRPRTILLAQMSKADADELSTHFGFDLVLAKADDCTHASPELTATLPASSSFVVVPRRAISGETSSTESSGCTALNGNLVPNPIGLVSRTLTGGMQTIGVTRELAPWELHTEHQTSAKALSSLVSSTRQVLGPAGASIADQQQAFQLAVLKILRDRSHANVAMLQKRDYYFGAWCESCNTTEQIERILWRGDAPRLLTVKGATLKKIVQESAKFKQAEQTLGRPSESGRWLVTLGIQKNDEGDYLVDGVVLDPARLYTVVTSNHLASGDTGYPDIKDPDLVDDRLPDPSPSNLENQRIAYIVCKSWPGASACVDGSQFAYPISQQAATDLGPTTSQRFRGWWGSIYNYAILPSQSTPESESQSEPSWRFSVKEISFSFSRAHNNLSEVDRASKLGGVSEPGVNAANSRSFGFALHSELVRSGTAMDEYARLNLDYASQTSSQSTQIGDPTTPNNLPHRVNLPDQFSLSSNTGVAEAGIFVHSLFGFPAPHKSFPKWGLVLGARVESPLRHEQFLIGPHFAADGTTDQATFSFFLPRTTRFLGRFGIRVENTDSYLEAGYQGGYQRHILDSVTTNQGACPLDADQTLDQCLGGQVPGLDPNTIVKTLKNAWPNGFYADFSWKLALPFTRISFITHDEAQSFQPENGDRNTQTRYRATLENKLSVPLFGNFSLEPGFDTLLYENKVAHTHLARITPKLSIKYSFDILSRVPAKKSLTYKSGGGE